MEKLNTVYLSLGSDLGDRKKNISDAIELIKKKQEKSKNNLLFMNQSHLGLNQILYFTTFASKLRQL